MSDLEDFKVCNVAEKSTTFPLQPGPFGSGFFVSTHPGAMSLCRARVATVVPTFFAFYLAKVDLKQGILQALAKLG